MRALLLVSLLTVSSSVSTTGCSFAQKHPGITVGLVTGAIGFATCGVSVEKLDTCSLIGAGAGLAIGGITGLVTTFADTGDQTPPPLTEDEEPVMRRRTRTAPPPGLPPGATPATYPVTSASQALELPVDLYTMDLRGSDAIWVIETPPDQPLTPARNTVIADAAGVAGIVDTLAKLPRRGPILKKLGPTVVIRLVGVSGGTARGYVELYDGQLKTESTGFYRAGDLEATRLERELHDQATRALATSPAP